MGETGNIQYLIHTEIDKTKWDACINKADNGLIYAYSFYLDHMTKHWDALVMNDYEAVMPLTWNKKYGIHYLYQPFLTAQLGVFGNNVNVELLKAFLKAIPEKFKYLDIYLNYGNVFDLNDFNLYQRSNYILNLNKSYGDLYHAYRSTTQRNIKKAEQAGCVVRKDFEIEKVIGLALQQMRGYTNGVDENVENFRKLYHYLHPQQRAITYGIFSAKDELLSSCVFFFSHNRAYYILVGNHPNGKDAGSSHALIDALIKDYAGKDMRLDFEGSDIRSLAFFYSSFGAVEEKYTAIKLNKLPWWLKWLKK